MNSWVGVLLCCVLWAWRTTAGCRQRLGQELGALSAAAAAKAASCRDLVRESDSGELLGRMQAIRAAGVPSLVLIGERNRGVCSSEVRLIAYITLAMSCHQRLRCNELDDDKIL